MYTNDNGGIEGHPVEIIVRDHGNEPQRGVECYEQLKRDGVFNFSTFCPRKPSTNAVLPPGHEGRKRPDAILRRSRRLSGDDGEVFDWVVPGWADLLAAGGQRCRLHQGARLGGDLSKRKDQASYLSGLSVRSGTDRDPEGTSPRKKGLSWSPILVPLPGSDQAGAWSNIRRDKPGSRDQLASGGRTRGRVQGNAPQPLPDGPLPGGELAERGRHQPTLALQEAKGILRGTNVAGGQEVPIVKHDAGDLLCQWQGQRSRELGSRRVLQHGHGHLLGRF